MAGVQIDGVNNKIDFDDDLDTSISANTDDTLVFEIAGATDFTMTANTFTAASGSTITSPSIKTPLIEFTDGDDAITIADGGGVTFPIASTFTLGFTSNAASTITTADNTDTLKLVSTDADANVGPRLKFFRDSSSPADNDQTGQVTYAFKNSAGAEETALNINCKITDVTDGTEGVQWLIESMTAGQIVNRLELDDTETVFNEDSVDVDFRVESNGNANALFINAGDDLIDFGVSGAGHLRPSFYASKDGTAQTIANETNTLVTFNTELIDSDGKFASNRFTPTIAGYYFINSTISMTNHPQNAYTQIRIKKNGADVFQEVNYNHSNSGEADTKVEASFVIYLDGNDYLEIFIRQNSGGNENTRTGHECRFMGYRIH